MTKKYNYSKDGMFVIITDSKEKSTKVVPFDHSNESVKGNKEYQDLIEKISNGDIQVGQPVSVEIKEPEITEIEKIWFIRALRQLNLKDGFDNAFEQFDDELKEDYSIINIISKDDSIIKEWSVIAKVKAKTITDVFVTANTIKKG